MATIWLKEGLLRFTSQACSAYVAHEESHFWLCACSPVNKDRVLDAMFNLPRMQLSTDDPPGTPTTLQVCY